MERARGFDDRIRRDVRHDVVNRADLASRDAGRRADTPSLESRKAGEETGRDASRNVTGRRCSGRRRIIVAVILDKRIAEKGYGKKFLKSLPPMLTTRRVENIARFLEEATYARAS